MGSCCSALIRCQLITKGKDESALTMWLNICINVILFPFMLCFWFFRIYVCPCFANTLEMICCDIVSIFLKNCGCSWQLKFTDTSFPCNDANAGKKGVKWARLQDIDIVNKAGEGEGKRINRLFNSIQPDDIAQGALGDCWLLAALAVLSERPHHIQNCFRTAAFSPRGKYTLRLFDEKSNSFQNITIDDFIPVNEENKPIYTGAKGNEMWPLLLEKAFAKMRGGYHALEGGLPLDAMMTITGFQGDRFDLENTEHCFTKCKKLFSAGCILACGSKGVDNTREEGRDNVKGSVVGGHAYSILGVYEPMLSTEKVRLLKLRNPWGSFEWQGRWSDKSDDWSKYPGVALEIGKPKDVDDGVFFIEWKDFVANYDFVDVMFPATSISDLHISNHEEAGVCGPTLGCILGMCRFWCMCKGFLSLWWRKDSVQLKKEMEWKIDSRV